MKNDVFSIKSYDKRAPFASFLPGIAGTHGIPIWCYYVSRGQCVVSFGLDTKDHAIMEFLPAHRAYAEAKTRSFRTFIRAGGKFTEAFSDGSACDMEIGMNALSLTCEDGALLTKVCYFVLPEERLGALVRRVSITNVSSAPCRLEVLDGMPEVVPYGVPDMSLKNMLETAKASMRVEDARERTPWYRVGTTMADAAQVGLVEGGNFALGFDEAGALLPAVADPRSIFGLDTSLQRPVCFAEGGLAGVLNARQRSSNLFPCAFFAASRTLVSGETLAINEIIGQAGRRGLLDNFLKTTHDARWFDRKLERAAALTDELGAKAATCTANPTFDAYCAYTYMDNVLRGGQSVDLGGKVFHVYSRKHGDLERDYNWFSMSPEFYSQGNGNFRDVNQNRRSDVFFSPFVGREILRDFFGLVQLDGYNPLSVERRSYEHPDFSEPFTPGALLEQLMDEDPATADARFQKIMSESRSELSASFGEGYWSDHWTYDLDLVEEYLAVYPEQERALFYVPEHRWFISEVNVAPRAKRYVKAGNAIRQYRALDEASRRKNPEKYLSDAIGQAVVSPLLEKLTLLCAVKFATLDPFGMGVEMEGGKPGWYDALNGLPGLFGSSMCETYELARLMDFTLSALRRNPGKLELLEEISVLLDGLVDVNAACRWELQSSTGFLPDFWNGINDVKEAYRERVFAGVTGIRVTRTSEDLANALEGLYETVKRGIAEAISLGSKNDPDVCPAYFAYDVVSYTEDADGIHPTNFTLRPIPAFLEGPTRRLKLPMDRAQCRALYRAVRDSGLYDRKLSMYMVNASLQGESFELGRCRAFTPGWLENGSIWLHMEYKYLLELLRAGLYEEYFSDLRACAVPFLDPNIYGRSTLENSSFIASSANPDPDIHARGFVARLSGSTAEFLSMWRIMFFGARPFTVEGGRLTLSFAPAIPDYLILAERRIRVTFLGATPVTYALPDGNSLFPGAYRVAEIAVTMKSGDKRLFRGSVTGESAEAIREGRAASIDVRIER